VVNVTTRMGRDGGPLPEADGSDVRKPADQSLITDGNRGEAKVLSRDV
jgi:hypothetical protein